MRKYRLYRFSHVIIPGMDIPQFLSNKIILLKKREPAVIIHIRQSPGKGRFDFIICQFFRFTIKVVFFQNPTNILHQESEVKSFSRFFQLFSDFTYSSTLILVFYPYLRNR